MDNNPSTNSPSTNSNEPTDTGEHEHDVLEAFNAEDAVERAGEPPREPDDVASDSDTPAPG